MNNNLIIGGVVVILLAGGAFLLWNAGSFAPSDTATSTPTTSETGETGTTDTPASAGVPTVKADAGAVVSNSTAVVTGKVTPNGAPTTYWYEYGETTALGSRTNAQAIGSGWSAIASPAYITGLRANTAYYFRLSAQNSQGTVNSATGNFSTNNNAPPVGNSPTASSNGASAVERTTATLNARVNPRGSETTYWFEYGTSANFGSISSFQSAGNGNAVASVSAPISGLAPATKYFFRVNAQNQFGTVNGATQNFTTKGPAAATAPNATTGNATAVTSTTAKLRGTVDPNGTLTTYWFEYSTDSLLGSVLLKSTGHEVAGSGTSNVSVETDVTGLSANTNYYFRIVAQSSAGTDRGDRQTFKTK